MNSRLFSRVTRAVIAALLLVAVGGQLAVAAARPEPGARRTQRGFSLFADVFTLFLVNRVACGVNNLGEICVDPGNSPIGGGGFWPRGTPDQYIFNSGLQIAGIIPADAGFEWAGDTTGAYFMDARGTQQQGEGITAVYNSLDPADAVNWPVGAIVRDTALFAPVLIGRNVISQQDLWSRSWDGNPNLLSGRTHPMGILVETRGLAWNFPAGNEDILYFVFNFYNITAEDPATYANLDPAIRDEIAAIGDRYHSQVETTLGVSLPTGGYTIGNTYAAFTMDPDVGDASFNYSTAILPFSLAIAYKSDWLEPGWVFPPDIFGTPFAPAPGFVGVKYLKSPADPLTGEEFGLTMFSNTRNAATAFPDPVGVTQLWRYLSGKVSPAAGDNPCSVTDPVARRICFQDAESVDTRFYLSSGPFTIDPGQVFTIVVAYVHAAAIAQYIEVGTNLPPGIPPSAADIAADPDNALRTIDRVAGWVSENDANQDAEIQQDEVTTVPRSILQKSLVAQEVYDKKFLLPAAPEPPSFYLVPGANKVSVVWEPSLTEQVGDPFYVIANDPTSALFDPNFRQIDVEGYRVYRGRTAGSMEMIAQFDYSGTYYRDYTGMIDYGNCAPELGITDECPVDFDFPITNTGEFNDVDIVSPLVQVTARDQLANGAVIKLVEDNALVDGGFPELTNSGVPFMYIDNGVVNSLTYFYTVVAFDVNSAKSGPSSLESAKIGRAVTPKALSPTVTEAELSFGLFGDDDEQLDPNALWTIDPSTGRFSGSPPPTDALSAAFAPLVPQLLPALDLQARIDSLVVHSYTDYSCAGNSLGSCYTIHLTFTKDGVGVQDSLIVDWPVWTSLGDAAATVTTGLGAVSIPIDPTSAARFGIPDTAAAFTAQLEASFRQYIDFSSFEGQAARRSTTSAFFASGAGFSAGGSRWFSGDNETIDHPGYGIRVGHLDGVDSIWAPIHHTDIDPGTADLQQYAGSGAMQCFGYAMAGAGRHADVQITWGAGGQVASVRDITHHVDVEYKPNPQASYGFISDNNGNGVLDFADYHYLETMSQLAEDFGFCAHTDPGPGARDALAAQPVIGTVSFDGETTPSGAVNSGTGFGLYINGERYLFALTGGQPPADGTVWTLRSYAGWVRASSGASTFTPSGYSFVSRPRPPAIPGLRVVFSIPTSTVLNAETDSSLVRVHTVPDPYYVTNAMEITTNRKVLKFVNLPPQAIIRIYTMSGVLVDIVEHNDPGLGGEAVWDLRNRNNQFVASGVYFYHVETAAGKKKVGRFTVVNYAQ
jgi:hypothetical protein